MSQVIRSLIRPVVAAFLLGALVKGVLIAVAEQSATARLIGWLLVDPAVPLIATPLTAAFFGQRAIVPGPQESFVSTCCSRSGSGSNAPFWRSSGPCSWPFGAGS